MRGFQTQTKRKAHATGYASGGMVRGPGTGISDDVPDQVPEGTYIMPADSTAQLGPDKLASMGARGFKAGGKKATGGKSVPVNLSNGEFKLPPEQVHAVGVQALEQMKNATHTPAAQQAGEPEMFFANGGAVFGSRGLEGLKAMIPKVEAMGFPQKQVAPPVAPAQGSRNVADLKAMIPQMEAMGFKQNPQYLADGGPVRREEGGGLSKEAVMAAIAKQASQQQPAQQASAQQASAQQQPAARGIAGLATDFLRNPGGILAQRERQAGGYADGGMVDEEQQRLANQTAMYVRGAQEAAQQRAQPAVQGGATPTSAPAPTAAGTPAVAKDPLDGGAVFGMYPQLAGGKRTTYAMDDKLRTGVQAAGPSTFAQATPTEKTIIGGGDGRRMNAEQDPRSLTATGMGAVAGVPGAAPSITPQTDVQRGGGNVPAVAPPSTNPAAPSPAATGAEIAPSVYRHGRGQYSDNAAGMGMPANFTGQPSAENMARMDAIANRSQQASMGRALSEPAGFQPQGVTAPTVRHSGNDWAARNALRNAEVSASSIMNTRRWGGRGAENNPSALAYQAMLKSDLALQGAQPGVDVAAMRENAGITREGMQQDGATTRTGMQEQGANTREAGRSALATEELGLKREAQGFQTRAAQQQEQLRNVLLDPKSTPAQRAVAQRNLAALSGKTAADRMQTVTLPDTTNEMGQVVRGGQALVRVLEDGTVQQVPIGAQAPAPIAAPKAGEVRNGYRFKGGNPNDQANWTKV